MEDFYCEEVFSGKTTVSVVHETTRVLAYHHTRPSYSLHIVIVPKAHIPQLIELTDTSLIQEIFEIAQKIIVDMKLHTKNYRIITNGGKFQDSNHLHFHLISE